MTERSAHDDALMDEIEAARRDGVDLDAELSAVHSRLVRIDTTPAQLARASERCLHSSARLAELGRHLAQAAERGTASGEGTS